MSVQVNENGTIKDIPSAFIFDLPGIYSYYKFKGANHLIVHAMASSNSAYNSSVTVTLTQYENRTISKYSFFVIHSCGFRESYCRSLIIMDCYLAAQQGLTTLGFEPHIYDSNYVAAQWIKLSTNGSDKLTLSLIKGKGTLGEYGGYSSIYLTGFYY